MMLEHCGTVPLRHMRGEQTSVCVRSLRWRRLRDGRVVLVEEGVEHGVDLGGMAVLGLMA
jgi:hypothetical protein